MVGLCNLILLQRMLQRTQRGKVLKTIEFYIHIEVISEKNDLESCSDGIPSLCKNFDFTHIQFAGKTAIA